jgi:hypothetical protein
MDKLNTRSELRNQWKVLLYLFAKENDQPGRELQKMIQEVISELYKDVAAATSTNRELRLVISNPH